jgi:hypothetical protein
LVGAEGREGRVVAAGNACVSRAGRV